MAYLDHNASSPLNLHIAQHMFELHSHAHNASSVHQYGRNSWKLLEQARRSVATATGISDLDDYNIIFTSSATEANNLAINSFKQHHIITLATEHLSILKPVQNCLSHTILGVDRSGQVDITALKEALSKPGHKLVSIMLANNETGIIHNIAELSHLTHQYGGIFHSDAVQAIGRTEVNITDLGTDMLTIASHKCGGPTGAACLIARRNIDIIPLVIGGGQEKGMRAGTENVIAISGLGIALDHCLNNNLQPQTTSLQHYLEERIKQHAPKAIIIGQNTTRLANTSCIIMPGVSNEVQLMRFDLAGIAVSAGSACSSGKITISHVLKAMGFSDQESGSAIRVSTGPGTTKEEIDQFITQWYQIYDQFNS